MATTNGRFVKWVKTLRNKVNMKLTLVGGTFDKQGGKSSSIIDKMMLEMQKLGAEVDLINGGTLEDIKDLRITTPILVWMPNIDNAEDKILPQIKVNYPKLLLVSSKRVVEKEYKESDIVGRLLKSKSNLGIMITKPGNKYTFQIIDPLGNQYAKTADVTELVKSLLTRIEFITKLTRKGSVKVGETSNHKIDEKFLETVRKFGERFSTFVNAVNPNRLLGNASTRCSFGFPAVREDGHYYVSERNIDKKSITSQNFVKVTANDKVVEYFGDKKPSVDTPIQIQLFNYFDNINYIIHGHVYVKGVPYTEHKLPCGAVEEIEELKALLPKDVKNACVNLKGHGCLILASSLDYFNHIDLEGRVCPEE